MYSTRQAVRKLDAQSRAVSLEPLSQSRGRLILEISAVTPRPRYRVPETLPIRALGTRSAAQGAAIFASPLLH